MKGNMIMRKKLLSLILAVSIILPGAAFAEKQTAAFEPACAFSRAEMAASLFSLLNFADLL